MLACSVCFCPIYSGVYPPFSVYTIVLRLFSVCSLSTTRRSSRGSHWRGENTGESTKKRNVTAVRDNTHLPLASHGARVHRYVEARHVRLKSLAPDLLQELRSTAQNAHATGRSVQETHPVNKISGLTAVSGFAQQTWSVSCPGRRRRGRRTRRPQRKRRKLLEQMPRGNTKHPDIYNDLPQREGGEFSSIAMHSTEENSTLKSHTFAKSWP